MNEDVGKNARSVNRGFKLILRIVVRHVGCIIQLLSAYVVWLCRSINNFSIPNAVEVFVTMVMLLVTHNLILLQLNSETKLKAWSYLLLFALLLCVSKLSLLANVWLDRVIISYS